MAGVVRTRPKGQHPVLFLGLCIRDSSPCRASNAERPASEAYAGPRTRARANAKAAIPSGPPRACTGKAIGWARSKRPDTCEGSGNRAFRYLASGVVPFEAKSPWRAPPDFRCLAKGRSSDRVKLNAQQPRRSKAALDPLPNGFLKSPPSEVRGSTSGPRGRCWSKRPER